MVHFKIKNMFVTTFSQRDAPFEIMFNSVFDQFIHEINSKYETNRQKYSLHNAFQTTIFF